MAKLVTYLNTSLCGLATFLLVGNSLAQPCGCTARVGYTSSKVTYSAAGTKKWTEARVNRPMARGDRIYATKGARTELQLGAATVRLDGDTVMKLLTLDSKMAQIQLTQGLLNIRVWRMKSNQVYEIDTPNFAFTIREPGNYFVRVDSAGRTSTAQIVNGKGTVFGTTKLSYLMTQNQSCTFSGTDIKTHQCSALAAATEFDNWCTGRDKLTLNSPSAQYVSRDMVGYEDLDNYGTWQTIKIKGKTSRPAWRPKVRDGWTPYRDGRWVWDRDYGWTWVDNQPWGFAPSHYGRWYRDGRDWYWIPGPRDREPYYAPSLVAFLRGKNFEIGAAIGGRGADLAWFPLGPDDIYIPPYRYDRDYFNAINGGNGFFDPGLIGQFFDNPGLGRTFDNQGFTDAFTAVPQQVFANGGDVNQANVTINNPVVNNITVNNFAPITPDVGSVIAGTPVDLVPPTGTSDQPVVVRNTPEADPAAFELLEPALDQAGGRPLDESVMERIDDAQTSQSEFLQSPETAAAPEEAMPASEEPADREILDEGDATPAAEEPEEPAAEEPEAPAAEEPEEPAAEEPEAPAAEEPEAPAAEEHETTTSEEQETTTSEEQETTTSEEFEPAPAEEREPAPAEEREPAPAEEREPAPAEEREPAPAEGPVPPKGDE